MTETFIALITFFVYVAARLEYLSYRLGKLEAHINKLNKTNKKE